MSSNKPILYSYFRSSCAWRVRIALALKSIDYEYKSVNLLKQNQLDEEYRNLNPMGQVPAFIISIIEFIEENWPEVREVSEIIASGIQPIQNLSILKKIGDERKMKWAHDVIQYGFVALEKILSNCSGKYCVGNEVTMADCCLVPQVYNARRFNVDMTEFPIIQKINDNLMELDAFKMAHPSKQPDCPPELR
ncbi:Maleylacetoacetate isomerase [Armadillidium nasatum]|uniref:maleylacetoacetate isomerase n=1 Tax=Armadillidium nasatum TaxID=96803 RepID=A0A5N5T0M6_9CRUS|nr:Maleylacetoacetate isomerase [Armadillidium nasatum]